MEIFAIGKNLLLQLVTDRNQEGEMAWWWWDTTTEEHEAYKGLLWNGDGALLWALLWALRAGMAIATDETINARNDDNGQLLP